MGVAIWQGFDFHWDHAPHRLNGLTSKIVEDRVEHVFTVGRVPDRGLARTWVTRVDAEGLRSVHGSSTVTATSLLGRRATSDALPVRVPLPDAEGATVVLQGFSIRCLSSSVGLHTRGFGVRLSDPRVHRGGLVFRPEAWVHAANSPDLLTSGGGIYSYEVELAWTVLSGTADKVSFERGRPVVHRHRGRSSEIAGELRDSGLEHAVLGVQGFAVDQRFSGRFGRDGRFIRRVQTGVDDLSRGERRARYRPHLHFSNRGVITYPIDVEHRLWTTLVGFRDGEARRQRVETPISTGIGAGGRGEVKLAT
ncbi:MAG: hypothetical protein KC912_22025 [Proteobacteria bacterium]|nr:hypothetical protein [Pseudomonadota bacterium]